MIPYYRESFYNPSSPFSLAVQVRRDYERAKKDIARAIGGGSGRSIITAGATESINIAFRAVCGHVVVPAIEHKAVLACARSFDHTVIGVDAQGVVSPHSIASAIRPDTQLVSVALANNEIGTIQPIRAIAQALDDMRRDRLMAGDTTPLYFHVDASQGLGLVDINVTSLGIDMLTLNASKVYGPKQVGLLWAAGGVRLQPYIVGGGQEGGIRGGTEDVAGTVGFATAVRLAVSERKEEARRLGKLRDRLQQMLLAAIPGAVVSGSLKHRLPNYLHVSFPGLDAERLVFLLEDRGILVGTGSACSANVQTRSHVLDAIGLPPSVADGSLRITLGRLSSEGAIERAGEAIVAVVRKERERTGCS